MSGIGEKTGSVNGPSSWVPPNTPCRFIQADARKTSFFCVIGLKMKEWKISKYWDDTPCPNIYPYPGVKKLDFS